jgi:hypothetical protein
MPIVAGIIISAAAVWTRAETPGRSFRSQDGDQLDRRSLAVPVWNDFVQVQLSRLSNT